MILLGFLMSLLTVAFNLAIPYISRFVIDRLTRGELQLQHLGGFLALYFAAAVGSVFLSFWMRSIPLRIGHTVETAIRANVFKHLTEMDQAYFRKLHTGDLMNRMSTDMRIIAMAVGQGFMQICRMIFVFVLAFAIMFHTCRPLALVILLLVPLMSLSFAWFAHRIKRHHVLVQEELSRMADFSQETFAGIQTVKAFSLERRWYELFSALNGCLVGRNMRLAVVHEAIWPLAAFWLALGSAVILIQGGRYVITGQLTLGELVQFNQYLLYMQWPLLSLGWILSLVQRGGASWKRVREIMEEQPHIKDDPNLIEPGAMVEGDILFEKVTVEVEGQTILQDISLRIPQGSRVGITGPTGSGKTTLVALLPRLIDPACGRILMGGRPLNHYALETLRGSIGVAEQEPTLFSDTISRNIAFGLAKHSEQKVLRAADIAHLHGDVEQFPDRYETMIGERGVTLSGGQRQRTSISRAVACEPAVLILDDVLASVDTATESAILDKLQPVFASRTTLFVSHRVSTLRDMDFIVTVEDGRITQQGTHDELVRQDGYYRKLCEIQELAAAVE
jgi:ATP-binding cassette subfamily B protein